MAVSTCAGQLYQVLERGVSMRIALVTIMAVVLTLGLGSAIFAGGMTIPDFIWVNGAIYATDSSQVQSDSSGQRNGLYIFQNLKWQRPVAEAGPGDKDYKDGTWQVTYLEYTPKGLAMFDVNDDGLAEFELTSWEKVQYYMNNLGCFKIVGKGPSFNCPITTPITFKSLRPKTK
jgi:hypothetical protein